jgi:hypothetical protein
MRKLLKSKKHLGAAVAALLGGLWLLQEVSPIHPQWYGTSDSLAVQPTGWSHGKVGLTLAPPDYVPKAYRSVEIERLLRRDLSRVGAGNRGVRMVSAEASLKGNTLLPLRKTGTCRFRVRFAREGGDTIDFGGQLQITATGLLSRGDLRQHISSRISRSLQRRLARDAARPAVTVASGR